jgi:hypothetical protein
VPQRCAGVALDVPSTKKAPAPYCSKGLIVVARR